MQRPALALAATIAFAGQAAAAAPFDVWFTNSPVIVARAEVSIFDVCASRIDRDRFFITHWGFGALSGWGISEYTIKRQRGKWIVGLENPASTVENRLWTHRFPAGAADFAKSLDILSEDAETVRVVTLAEDNATGLKGSIQLFTVSRHPTNSVVVNRWKDLTGERADGGDAYNPEGLPSTSRGIGSRS